MRGHGVSFSSMLFYRGKIPPGVLGGDPLWRDSFSSCLAVLLNEA